MFNARRTAIGLTALLLGAGLPAGAQPTSGSPYPQDRQNQPAADAARMRAVSLVPAERLLGANIAGADGKDIGEINDLVIERRTGRVVYALVGQGGVLGMGERVVAVPFSAFGWSQAERRPSLNMTREKLKAAPSVGKEEWKTLNEPSRTDEVYRYYSVDRQTGDAEAGWVLRSKLSESEWPLLRASDIRGKKLMSDDGRDLGNVNDLVIDASSGRIAFAAVTFGSTLGIGGDRVAVPWPMLDVNKEGGLFASRVDKDQLKAAPKLAGSDWAELNDPRFGSRVYTHYGVSAPWLERAANAPGATAMDDAAIRRYNAAYTSGSERTIKGTVASVSQTSPSPGVPEVATLSVRTDAGDTATIQLAPMSYLDQNKVSAFKTGDTVAIKGRWATIEGRNVLIASEVQDSSGKAVSLRKSTGEPAWTWK